jgi:hypothetical protein
MPDPTQVAKFNRWEAIKASNPSLSNAEITAQVEREFSQPSFLKGAARSLGQGLTAQFGDEIEAGVRSAFSPQSYREIRDQIRGEQASFQADNPKLSTALEIGGGVLPVVAGTLLGGPAGGAAAASRSLPSSVARGAITGAAYGGASGAGMAPEMRDVPRSSAIGAGFGLAAGGALPVAGRAIGAVGTGAMNAAEKVTRDVAASGGRMGALAQRAVPALDERAQRIARQNITQKLADDMLTPEQAAENLAGMQARGVPAAVVDAGEENTLELLNSSYLVPGPGRRVASQYAQERVSGLAGRLSEQVERLSGARIQNLNRVLDDIAESRKAPAREMYTQAFTAGPVALSDDTARLLTSPATGDLRRAWTEGWRRSTLDEEVYGNLPALKPLFGAAKDAAGKETGELALIRPIEVRDIDYIKRGLDAQINRELGRAKPDGDLVRLLTGAKNKLLAEVDGQVPIYREARQFWSGKQGLMDALNRGKRFQFGSDDDFADLVQTMTPDELLMYRRGVANQIAETLRRRDGRTVSTLNVLTDPTAQNRLRQIFPDEESFNLLKRVVDDEVKGAAPYRRLTGQSQTAQNLAGLGDLVMTSSAGLPLDPKTAAMQSLFNLMSGNTRAVAEQQAKLLTRSGPQGVDFLRRLQTDPNALDRTLRALIGPSSGGVLGGRIGGSFGSGSR